ncbi:hypothetical protein [Arthrobacter sp. 4R501]|uniref:hypothetical protein n=1 Tax=Arthrobacter sp. 4R501 TaxID=2058886 RepID=UPI0015E41395|nr:hypothetical protein [Arthrobacter sp. 4R501]
MLTHKVPQVGNSCQRLPWHREVISMADDYGVTGRDKVVEVQHGGQVEPVT